jgi:TPR repeat protein
MHDTAFAIGRKFFELYGDKPGLRVVDVGSQDVNGTLRDALPQDCEYIGVDLEPGTWYRAAAEGGSPTAFLTLGRMQEAGRGMPADPEAALVFYRRAAAGGIEAAAVEAQRLEKALAAAEPSHAPQ